MARKMTYEEIVEMKKEEYMADLQAQQEAQLAMQPRPQKKKYFFERSMRQDFFAKENPFESDPFSGNSPFDSGNPFFKKRRQ